MRSTCAPRSCACRRRPSVVREETFAPILYALTYRDLDEAVALHNDVPAGPLLVHLHDRPARGRALPRGRRQRLRHRQRQHRPERRRDRRRVRRREGHRRRPRVRLGRLARLHAPPDGHDQRLERAAARPGHRLRRRLTLARLSVEPARELGGAALGLRRERLAGPAHVHDADQAHLARDVQDLRDRPAARARRACARSSRGRARARPA